MSSSPPSKAPKLILNAPSAPSTSPQKQKITLKFSLSSPTRALAENDVNNTTNAAAATAATTTKELPRDWTSRCAPTTDLLPNGLDKYMNEIEYEELSSKGYTRAMLAKRAAARKLEAEKE